MKKTKFKGDPSALYMETLAHLRGLLQEEGLDTVHRVYADAAGAAIKQDFREYRDLDKETAPGERQIGTLKNPPGDHFTGWTRDGKRMLLLSQPYHINGDDLLELAMGAKAHGLDLRISAESYYFPGKAILVELWKGWNPWRRLD